MQANNTIIFDTLLSQIDTSLDLVSKTNHHANHSSSSSSSSSSSVNIVAPSTCSDYINNKDDTIATTQSQLVHEPPPQMNAKLEPTHYQSKPSPPQQHSKSQHSHTPPPPPPLKHAKSLIQHPPVTINKKPLKHSISLTTTTTSAHSSKPAPKPTATPVLPTHLAHTTPKKPHSISCTLGMNPTHQHPITCESSTLVSELITGLSKSINLDYVISGPVMNEFRVTDTTTSEVDLGYTMFEQYTDLNLIRPIRPFEHVSDVLKSWDSRTRNSLCIHRDMYFRAPEYALMGPPMAFSSVLYCETRPGKYKKRVVELRLGDEAIKYMDLSAQFPKPGTLTNTIISESTASVSSSVASLWVHDSNSSITTTTSGSTMLCSLAHFDAYTIQSPPPLVSHQRPTKYAFALKNVSATMSQFEEQSEFVKYLYAESAVDVRGWVLAIRAVKAHVDRYMYPERFNGGGGKDNQQTNACCTLKKSLSSKKTPQCPVQPDTVCSSNNGGIDAAGTTGPYLRDLSAPTLTSVKHGVSHTSTNGKPLLDFGGDIPGFNHDRPTLLAKTNCLSLSRAGSISRKATNQPSKSNNVQSDHDNDDETHISQNSPAGASVLKRSCSSTVTPNPIARNLNRHRSWTSKSPGAPVDQQHIHNGKRTLFDQIEHRQGSKSATGSPKGLIDRIPKQTHW